VESSRRYNARDQVNQAAVSFEFKLAVVQRYLAGEAKVALAQEFELSSPDLIKKWARYYRDEGEDGLRPKPKGRPKTPPEAPAQPAS